jgi:hypothetical protein
MSEYINDDSNYYCPKCKNIILLPNAATPLCNTCFKEEYKEKIMSEMDKSKMSSHIEIVHACPECGLSNFEPLAHTDLCRDCHKKQFKDEIFNKTKNIIVPGETHINGKTYSNQELFELGVIQINENKNNQTKSIIGINKDAFEIGKWYKITDKLNESKIAILAKIEDTSLSFYSYKLKTYKDLDINKEIDNDYFITISADSLEKNISKIELLDDLIKTEVK